MYRRHVPIKELDAFRKYVAVADWIWNAVGHWPRMAQDTVGTQLIRAADSVGANLVEGDARSTDPDAARFFVIARASAREARYWLRRAAIRGLVSEPDAEEKVAELTSATQMLNRLIAYRRAGSVGRVSDVISTYDADPFSEDQDLNSWSPPNAECRMPNAE